MKRLILVAVAGALVVLAFVPMAAAQEASSAEYRLYLRFDPQTNFVEGKARIENPSGACFYVSSALTVQRAYVDGKSARVRSASPDWVPGAREVCLESEKFKVVEIEYSGRLTAEAIRKATTQTNMVEPRLIELSDFVDWYPRMTQGGGFRYTVVADLPAGFVTVLNGRHVKEFAGKARSKSEWKSFGITSGITLVAAPQLKKAEIEGGGTRIEIYYDKLPQAYIESMRHNLLAALQSLQSIFGTPGKDDLVRVVYCPRGAGGYARAPLFMVSELFALEQIPHPFGPARDLRFNIHEMAHYWSRADVNTADDWINEGLAEFAALLVSEEIVGNDFGDQLLSEYEETVDNAPTTHSVLETEEGSFEANVNRYYKPTLLLNDLQRQYGDARMRQFLHRLYARFNQGQRATTAVFLDQLEQDFGNSAREQFAAGLARKTWAKSGPAKAPASVADVDFLGTWTGVLTQSGTPYRFVLHLKSQEGVLVATLDSPDQNVKDVPVSEVSIAGDTLTLKAVGVAPASYRSRIDRASHTLAGEWVQMGIVYPLNLKRSEQ